MVTSDDTGREEKYPKWGADNNTKTNRGSNPSPLNHKLKKHAWRWALVSSTYFHFNICSHNSSVVGVVNIRTTKTVILFSNVNAEGKRGTVFLSSQKQNTSKSYSKLAVLLEGETGTQELSSSTEASLWFSQPMVMK